MASAQTTEVFNCTPEQFFAIITDYPSYPQFMSEVERCEVLHEEGSKKLVEFHINLIKTFKYKLWLTEEPHTKLSWVLDSGDMMKKNDGLWELTEEAGKTRINYQVDLKLKLFVPGAIEKTVASVNLPNMMSSIHKRVEELYGQ